MAEYVSGKKKFGASLNLGSEEFFEYACDPCNFEGEHVEAVGFCTECMDYLCHTCFKSHSRNKASRKHILLDKDKMPKKYKLCDPCNDAGDEEKAEGYCSDCCDYLCRTCLKSHSRNKASKDHKLLDKANMPNWTDRELASSMAEIDIPPQDTESLNNEDYTYIRDIDIKANGEEKDCYVTDMTLVSRTELVLTDQNNRSLKLVDLEKNVVKDSLTLQTFPNGLTKISQDQIALVLENRGNIQIVSVSNKLSVVQTLKTDGKCVVAKFVNGRLYVSFKEPVKFQILQATGEVYKTITPDADVLKHCSLPRHMAISPDGKRIYVSDWKTNKVLSIDINGSMLSMYEGELNNPQDIIFSPLGLYLCNRDKHVVYKITSDLSKCTEVLKRGDGLYYPVAICFHVEKRNLYISNVYKEGKYCNFIKKFSWK